MAFGYKLPNFNTWGRYWLRRTAGLEVNIFRGPYYFPCQWKHIENAFRNCVLTPPRLPFRQIETTPQGLGDIIQIAGNETRWWVVVSVFDIGGGFFNEHRSISVADTADETEFSERGFEMPSMTTTLVPPPGAVMMPERLPADFWDLPDFPMDVIPP